MATSQNNYTPLNRAYDELRKSARVTLVIQGIVGIILGILFLIMPIGSIFVLSIWFGAWMLVGGVLGIVEYFARDKELRSGWALANAIISIIAGVVVMVWPGSAAVAITLIIAIWTIVFGVMAFASSFTFKRLGSSTWWALLVFGIIAVILGIVFMFNLGGAMVGIIWALGVFAIMAGVAAIVFAVQLKKPKAD